MINSRSLLLAVSNALGSSSVTSAKWRRRGALRATEKVTNKVTTFKKTAANFMMEKLELDFLDRYRMKWLDDLANQNL
jgi:hypothetical protein